MKALLYAATLLLFIFYSPSVSSQDLIRQQKCVNGFYQPQIDSLKKLMASERFVLMREASMTMESEYEMPVIMDLSMGIRYHFIFIGDPGSAGAEVKMYDLNENQVFYKKNITGDLHNNIINFSYSPLQSANHMIKPVQVNKVKKKGLCGYVMLFKQMS